MQPRDSGMKVLPLQAVDRYGRPRRCGQRRVVGRCRLAAGSSVQPVSEGPRGCMAMGGRLGRLRSVGAIGGVRAEDDRQTFHGTCQVVICAFQQAFPPIRGLYIVIQSQHVLLSIPVELYARFLYRCVGLLFTGSARSLAHRTGGAMRTGQPLSMWHAERSAETKVSIENWRTCTLREHNDRSASRGRCPDATATAGWLVSGRQKHLLHALTSGGSPCQSSREVNVVHPSRTGHPAWRRRHDNVHVGQVGALFRVGPEVSLDLRYRCSGTSQA